MPAPWLNAILVPPHQIWTYFGSPSGPTDATYLDDWLCDAQSSRPLRGTSGSGTYGVGFGASRSVNFVSLINTNVSVNATISGAVSGTLVANAVSPDGTYKNPFLYFASPGSGSSISAAISGNPSTIVIGELVAGLGFELGRPIQPGGSRSFDMAHSPREDDFDMMVSYDLNAKTRRFVGDTILTRTQLQQVEDCYVAQRGFSLPCVLVPTPSTENDAWFGRLESFEYEKRGPEFFMTRIIFQEYALIRWS